MVDEKFPRYETFTDWARARGAFLVQPIAHFLAHVGLTPNVVTVLGLLLNVGVGFVIALGHLQWGGGLLLLASATDSLDGTLARATGQASHFGAFLDSTLDRISEGALFLGLLAWLLPQSRDLDVYLVFLAILGSVMVSYTRARAEGVGYECQIGLFTRVERILTLGIGLMFGWIRFTLIVMAVLVWFTVGQRMWHVWRVANGELKVRG